MLLTPKLHSVLERFVAALQRGDDATVAALLASSELAGRGSELAQGLGRWFPQVRTLTTTGERWPDTLCQRCLLWLQDERVSPYASYVWLVSSKPPHGLNWMVPLDDLAVATLQQQRDAEVLWRHFQARDLDLILNALQQMEAGGARAWCWLGALMFSSADRHAGEALVCERLEALIDSSADLVPGPLQALMLARQASSGLSPQIGLQRSLRGLKPGLPLDLALSAALTGFCNSGVLAADLVERLRVSFDQQAVLISRTRGAKRWHQALSWLLKAGGLSPQFVLAETTSQDASREAPYGYCPAHGETADGLCRLADEIVARQMEHPVTLVTIGVLLRRLRRPDLLRHPSLEESLSAIDAPTGRLLQKAMSRADQRFLGLPIEAARVATEPPKASLAVGNPVRGAAASPSGADVTICVLNYNGSLATHRLIAGLCRLWPGFCGEVMILDNASDADDLARLTLAIAKFWPGRLRIFKAPDNLGIGPARNYLFGKVATGWILSVDNDMVPIADLGVIVADALASPEAEFFNLAYEEIDSPGVAGFGKAWSIEPGTDGERLYKTHYLEFGPRSPPGGVQTYITSNRLSGGASLFRKDAFFGLGGYEASFAIGYEDYEFSFRMAERGFSVLTPRTAAFVHGHLAPRDAVEISSVAARFDAHRLRVARASFEARLGELFQACDQRSAPAVAFREIPRRLDFRFVRGEHGFQRRFAAARSVAIINGGTIEFWDGLPFDAHGRFSSAIFDQSEFPTREHALLLLQAFSVIVGDWDYFAGLQPEACRDLGLSWGDGATTPAPILCGVGANIHGGPQKIYDGGPALMGFAQVTDFVAVLIR